MTGESVILFLTLVMMPAVNLFPIIYAFRNWRATPQGRGLMVRSLGDMILIDMIVATLWLGEEYPGHDLIRLIGYALFVGGSWYVFLTLLTSRGARSAPPFRWRRPNPGSDEGPSGPQRARERV